MDILFFLRMVLIHCRFCGILLTELMRNNHTGGVKDIMRQSDAADIQNIIRLLDGFCEAGESRLKLQVSGENAPESVHRQYHHGRCDVDSPWAKGTAFDVLE